MNKSDENAYKNAYNKDHYTRITILLNKNTDLLSRIEDMQIISGKSRNTIVIEAIEEYLKRHKIS